MTTGIHTIVDQLLGGARIPESAAPTTRPSLDRERNITTNARGRVLAALDGTWRSAFDIFVRAGVSDSTTRKWLPRLVQDGEAEAREVPWAHGVRVEYRRAG